MPQQKRSIKIDRYGHSFDSLIECQTFEALLAYIAPDKILVHYPLLLSVENEWFPESRWKVDFYIPELTLYIEVKGRWADKDNDKCRANLRQLAAQDSPILDRLLFVSSTPNQRITRKHKTLNITQLHQILKQII